MITKIWVIIHVYIYYSISIKAWFIKIYLIDDGKMMAGYTEIVSLLAYSALVDMCPRARRENNNGVESNINDSSMIVQ